MVAAFLIVLTSPLRIFSQSTSLSKSRLTYVLAVSEEVESTYTVNDID